MVLLCCQIFKTDTRENHIRKLVLYSFFSLRRIALHKYDPPDLIQTSLDEGSSKVSSLADSVDSHSAHTIQDMLSPIDVVMTTPPPVARMRHGDSPKPSVVRRMTFDSPYGNGGSPISVLSASSGRHCLDDRSDDEEDSDDDLL